jgi:hypothetical protein
MERTFSCSMNISNCSQVDGAKFTVLRMSDRFSRVMNKKPRCSGAKPQAQTLEDGKAGLWEGLTLKTSHRRLYALPADSCSCRLCDHRALLGKARSFFLGVRDGQRFLSRPSLRIWNEHHASRFGVQRVHEIERLVHRGAVGDLPLLSESCGVDVRAQPVTADDPVSGFFDSQDSSRRATPPSPYRLRLDPDSSSKGCGASGNLDRVF